jgi:hypothetical protein
VAFAGVHACREDCLVQDAACGGGACQAAALG